MKWIKITIYSFSGIVLLLLLLMGAVFTWNHFQVLRLKPDSTEASSLLIQNVQLIPMLSDSLWKEQEVLIEDGRIVAIGTHLEANDALVINGEGQFLLPGLIDMHVHVWDEYELLLYLQQGVTAIRNVWGLPFHLRMKAAIEADELMAPAFLTSGPKLTGPEFIGDDNWQLFSPEEGRNMVRYCYDEGYDLIKTYYGLPEATFDAIREEALSLEMDIVAHPSPHVPYTYHLQTPIRSVEHAEDVVQVALNYSLDTAQLMELAQVFAQQPEVAFCPTLTVFHNIYQLVQQEEGLQDSSTLWMNPLIKMVDSEAQWVNWHERKQRDSAVGAHLLQQHRFHLLVVKAFHDAGVKIVCGTDAGIGITAPGRSIHRELAFYVQAGMTPFEALQTATVHAAQVHRAFADMGTIAPGQRAHLLLLKENPLANIHALQHIDKVILQQQIIEVAALEEKALQVQNRNNWLVTAWRYAEYLLQKD